LKGTDSGTTVYTGDLPGNFSPDFFLFLVAWLPPFLIGAYLLRRYIRASRN